MTRQKPWLRPLARARGLTLTILLIALGFSTACIKPPDDQANLGDEVSAQQVTDALTQARAPLPSKTLFRVGDSGVIKISDAAYTNSSIRETDIYTITSIENGKIQYTQQIVESGQTLSGSMDLPDSQKENAKPITATTPVTKAAEAVIKIFSKIKLRFASAWAEDSATNISRDMTQTDLSLVRTLGAPVSVQADGAAPAPAPASSGNSYSRYYGLKTKDHIMITKNCTQLKQCSVNSTHIEFNEIKTNSSGETSRYHWGYEISKEVPGLFTIMKECVSTMIASNNAQIPYMNCSTVDTFQFGPE